MLTRLRHGAYVQSRNRSTYRCLMHGSAVSVRKVLDVSVNLLQFHFAIHSQAIESAAGLRGWQLAADGVDGQAWRLQGLQVIWSLAIELDERIWLHVSASRPNRLPSYEEMAEIKAIFIGGNHYAYSVWPPKAKHVNIHDYALHLWSPIDGEQPLPDFTRGGNSI